MRIVFNTSFENGTRAVASAAEALAEANRQVASGRRVGTISQDPLGAASAISEHAVLDRLDAYGGATDAAVYRLGLADTVLTDMVNQLTSAQTTALSARGSAQSQGARDAAANELLAIRDALMADVSTQFQGAYLFSGSNVTHPPFLRTLAGFSAYQGDDDQTAIEISTGRTVSATFDGGSLMQGGDAKHVMDALTDLAAAVSAGDDDAIASGVDALGRAFDRATAMQARIGNDLQTTDSVRAQLSAVRVNSIERLSSIEDADLAAAGTRLAQAQTAYRAALSAMSTVGQLSLMDYLK